MSLRILLIVVSLSKAFPLLGEAVPHPRRRALADAPTETPSFVPKKVDPNGKLWVNEEHFPAEAAPMIKAIKESKLLLGVGLFAELAPGYPKATGFEVVKDESGKTIYDLTIMFDETRRCHFSSRIQNGKLEAFVLTPQYSRCQSFLRTQAFEEHYTSVDTTTTSWTFRFIDPTAPWGDQHKAVLALGLKALKDSGFVKTDFDLKQDEVIQFKIQASANIRFEVTFRKGTEECTIVQSDRLHRTFEWAKWSPHACRHKYGHPDYANKKTKFTGITRNALKAAPYFGFSLADTLFSDENSFLIMKDLKPTEVRQVTEVMQFVGKEGSDFLVRFDYKNRGYCGLVFSQGPNDKVPLLYKATDYGIGCERVVIDNFYVSTFRRA